MQYYLTYADLGFSCLVFGRRSLSQFLFPFWLRPLVKAWNRTSTNGSCDNHISTEVRQDSVPCSKNQDGKFLFLLGGIETELTCSICEQLFTTPVTLPCLHSFCSKCIEQLCEKCNNTNVSCVYPACRSPFDVPDGDVSELLSSFYLKALLKLIQVIGTKEKWKAQEIQHCGSCENPTSNLVAFCQGCTRVICNECVNAHKLLKRVSKEHKVTMLNEINRDKVEDFVTNFVFCEEQSHENNRLHYFCFEETCKKYICLKCVAEDHKLHNFSSLDDAADKVKHNIKQYMKRIDDLKQGYGEEISLSKQNISRIESEVNLAKKQVHDAVEVAIMCRTSLKTNVKWRYKSPRYLSSKPIERNARLRYVSQVPEVENMGEIMKNLPDPSNCTIESLKDGRCGFQNQFEILTKNSEGEVCDTNIESIYVEVKDPDGNEMKSQVFGKQKGKFSVSYRADRVGPCTILVKIAGELVKNSSRNVNTLDVKSDFICVKWFGGGRGEGEFMHPRSIALSENGEIAVGDRDSDRIQIFYIEGEYTREIKCREIQESEKFQPHSVTFIEDKLIVTVFSAVNGEILMIDLKSSNVRTIYRPEERFVPRGMCVTDENHIAVCYSGNEEHGVYSGIKLFDREGTFLREFHSPEKIKLPWCVAYGNRKYFVSYYEECCIRVFDSNGVFLHKFGEKGQDGGQFHNVAGLAFYGPNLILVCDHANNRVQLLTQEGKFVKSFGNAFSSMSRPADLAVTSDGHVFVLNFGSKNVQLWR
ncbi:tripartite motif-containing protein 2-like [Actinia tenebrosa]|uniref:Tripartite motif-containing protein 2-like n=1 Tax=Actinia tenebrosa TaxID=6105 RepID=A0A6P8JC68_ACTTE|nr:tripartite motif-containing protein 2-like [Actinia tenebrosa]